MSVQEQIKNYIASLPEPKRSEMQELHSIILEVMPACKLWFLDGKNSENKTVSNPNMGFTIRDEVELDKPEVVTSVLHGDASFQKEGNNHFSTTAGRVKLLIEVLEPNDLQSAIDSNVVTAASPPGSVDKGERQERGQKLLLSTGRPLTSIRFLIRLKLGAYD